MKFCRVVLNVLRPCRKLETNFHVLNVGDVSIYRAQCHTRRLHSLKTKKSQTLYDVLGVLPTATQTEIKDAYYNLALQYHPDQSIDLEADKIFQEISEAYRTLGNVTTRKEYDREVGAYFTLKGSAKKEIIRPVWRLMDDQLVNIDARKLKKGEKFICHLTLLSSILGVPVRISNICRNSPVQGIPPGEMRTLMLLRQICNGTLSGTSGSTTLTFLPSDLQCGRFYIDSYQYGNVSTLITSTMPSLMFVPPPRVGRCNILFLNGPTYAYNGLHIDHVSKVYKPVMNWFGGNFDVEVKKRGYLPYGRGSVLVRSYPISNFHCVEMVDPGTVTKITCRAFVAGGKPVKIAQRMAKEAHGILKEKFPGVEIVLDSLRESDSRAEGMGQGLLIVAETSTSCVFSGAGLWKKGAETGDVVQRAVGQLLCNVNSGGCVDDWMQEQIIIPMALANGNSVVRTGPLTLGTRTAIKAVKSLTKVRFKIFKKSLSGIETNIIKCKGLGYTNLYL